MHRLMGLVLLLITVPLAAQQSNSWEQVDSLTYHYYIEGEWDSLIDLGNKSIQDEIDFKWFWQRMGYANFMKSNYFAAQKYYENALKIDPIDAETQLYLYYCGLNTGNLSNARFWAKFLPEDYKTSLLINAVNPIYSIDLEYNYKLNNSAERSNPSYMRIGLFSQLGYQFSIYQSASNYSQIVDSLPVKQPDYYILLSYTLGAHSTFSAAYHYLNTSISGYKYPGHLVFGTFNASIHRFNYGINASFFTNEFRQTSQIGLQAGIGLKGPHQFYFNTYVSGLFDTLCIRPVFAEFMGARVYKNLWAEASITLGNIQNYHDHNALYIYNSIDPTLFRSGISLFWKPTTHFTLYFNYLYDTKQYSTTTTHYYQQSLTGGIIWKL